MKPLWFSAISLAVVTALSCKTVNQESSVRSTPSDMTPPASGTTNNSLAFDAVHNAIVEARNVFYESGDIYSKPMSVDATGKKQPPPMTEVKSCLAACPPKWSDIVCHYYSHLPSYSAVIPNIRGCFSSVVRSSVQMTDGSTARPLTYTEAYDYCVFQDFDAVLGRSPAFDPAAIATNKASGKKPGVMKWIDDNQEKVFKYLMWTGDNRSAFNLQEQHDVLNKAYGVALSKKDYKESDAADVASCRAKRPVRPGDATDGTHCTPPPPPPPAAKLDKATFVALGLSNSCVLDGSGKAYCAGNSVSGVLGNGLKTGNQVTLQPIKSDIKFRQISPGGIAGCGVSTDDKGYCWGNDRHSQFGLVALSGGAKRPLQYDPLEIPGIAFQEIQLGLYHTCGLATDGTVYCWGSNTSSQLGIGTKVATAQIPTPVAGGQKFKSLSVGAQSSCAIATDDKAFCWGLGNYGALGNGTHTNANIPTEIPGLTFDSIVTALHHSCGITTDSKTYCWGYNNAAGISSTTRFLPSPVEVAGGFEFVKIAAASAGNCGLAKDRKLMCWGEILGVSGSGGQVTTTPTAIATSADFKDFFGSSSANTYCGLGTDNAVYCWGRNQYGQLATGDVFDKPIPAVMAGF